MAYVNYSPWADAANVGRGLGESLTNLLIALPRLRQQAMLNAAHERYYDAEARRAEAQRGLYEAQAGYEKSRTGEVDATSMAKERLGNALRQIPTTIVLGGSINPLISDAVDNLAKLPHSDRASLAETLAQMIEMGNPRYRQMLGLGQPMLSRVGPEDSLYNAITGEHEGERGIKLGYGQRYVSSRSGETLAQGADRPLGDVLHSGAIGSFARQYADPDITEQEREAVLTQMPKFFQAIPSIGIRSPNLGPTNAPVQLSPRRVRKFNPATGKIE